MKIVAVFLFFFLFSFAAQAQECVPPPGGKCLTASQFEDVKKALEELDKIHKSPATVSTSDTVKIVQDFQGNVYSNGGEDSPIRLHMTLGDTVNRDMSLVLPVQLYARPKPPDPMFRLRIRAQLGLLFPQIVSTITGDKQPFVDGGIGWDFFHYKALNVAAYTGVRSVGGGLGFDLTNNFGPYVGYALVYDGLRSSVQGGIYFAFLVSEVENFVDFSVSLSGRLSPRGEIDK